MSFFFSSCILQVFRRLLRGALHLWVCPGQVHLRLAPAPRRPGRPGVNHRLRGGGPLPQGGRGQVRRQPPPWDGGHGRVGPGWEHPDETRQRRQAILPHHVPVEPARQVQERDWVQALSLPAPGEVTFQPIHQGEPSRETQAILEEVIKESDSFPTYKNFESISKNFAKMQRYPSKDVCNCPSSLSRRNKRTICILGHGGWLQEGG